MSQDRWLAIAKKAEAAGDTAYAQQIYQSLEKQGLVVAPGATAAGASVEVVDGDDVNGLPMFERAQLGAMSPEQQRGWLKKRYGDVGETVDGRLTVPRDGGRTGHIVTNPPDLDMGDVAEHGRIAAEVVGGGVGGLLGALVSSPTVAGVPVGVAAGGALGSQLAGEGYDFVMRSTAGVDDERSLSEVGKDLAMGGALDFVMPFAFGKVADGLKGWAGKWIASDKAKDVAEAAAKQHVTPTAAMLGNERVSRVEGALESIPFGGSGVAREAVTEDMAKALSRSLNQYTTMHTQQQLGEFVRSTATRYIDNWRDTAADLYAEVGRHVSPRTRLDMDNLRRVVNQRRAEYANDPAFDDFSKSPLWRKLEAAVSEQDDIGYSAISSVRSDIGKAIGAREGQLVSDSSQGELKHLYEALSADIEAGLRNVSDEAYLAFKTASDHYRNGMDVIDGSLKPILGKADKTPEAIFTSLSSQSKRGATHLTELVNQGVLQPGDVDKLAAGILHNFATPNPGAIGRDANAFSPATFATKYHRLSPEARKVLFEDSALKDDVSDIMLLAGAWKDAGLDINSSRTGNTTNMANWLGGGGGGTAGVTAGLLSGDPTLAAASAVGGAITGAAIPALTNKLLQSGLVKNAMAQTNDASQVVRLLTGHLISKGIGEESAQAAAVEAVRASMPTPIPVPDNAPGNDVQASVLDPHGRGGVDPEAFKKYFIGSPQDEEFV